MSSKGKPVNPQSRLNPPLPRGPLAAGQMAQWDGQAWVPIDAPSGGTSVVIPGTGTVTSVGLMAPKEFVTPVSGTPVTTAGTLTLAWLDEAANKFFAGPASGSATQPGFRSIVSDDLPAKPVFGGLTGKFYTYNPATSTYWSWELNAIGVIVTTDTGSGSPP